MISPGAGQVVAAGGRWHLGIGDPDAISWVIVAAYAVTVGLAVWAHRSARRGVRAMVAWDRQEEAANQRLLARLWIVIAVVLLALGLNKQLDLQTWFLQTMRRKAYEGGWYDDRRRYQAEVIAAAMVASVVAAAVVAYVLRRVLSRVVLTLLGLCTLVLFVGVRAVSFHVVDEVLGLGGRINVNVVLELSGIGSIAVSVLWWQRGERRLLRRTAAFARPPTVPVPSAVTVDASR